ncbi:MAG: flagellar protein FliS [Novosphingobium sp.]|nr:flagellar protein FliS [Novosphingobium sp.]
MLAQRNPQEAYRRVDFDARIEGADTRELIGVCYEQFVTAIGTAIFAAERGDNGLKSRSITRALSAITALQLGVSGDGGVADALRQLYGAARRAVLDSALRFDAETLGRVRQDFLEVNEALHAA